ncbi:hypothetical protein ACN42_g2225 [Penicillium freii]|uniref:Uncharacterized protein n=1 Tax=Penicillium freii TaxID=48697 RepID=A0A101MQF0_PENFR|nr:hypothetical protein ACN42_g2225 [Penicillium freii]
MNNHDQSDRGGLRLQDNRQTGQSTFDEPLRELLSTSNTHIHQSDRGGLRLQDNRQTGQSTLTVAGSGFRTIGRLSDCGGLRLQDNRQTSPSTFDEPPGSATHFELPPLRTPSTSNTHIN